MAEERIDSLFDVPAILKERDTVLAAMKSITDEMAKSTVDASKQKSILTDAKTAKEAAAAITQVDAETKKLSNSTKKLSDEQNALNRLNKTLVRTKVQQSEAGQKVVNALDRERAELKAISFERQKAIQQERSQADYTRAFAKELDLASMNISEMQRELSRLNAMSFKGLDAKQIAHVKGQMAMLTEEIGDQRKAIAASGDKFNVMVGALQGLVGVTQLVTGTMSMFGVENKKLEKTMIQLIGISQGLNAIHELQEKGTLKVAAATIKEAAAKVKLTIVTWAQQKADTASVGAMQKVFAWIAKNPYIALALGIAAATAAVWGLIRAFSKEVDIEGDLGKSQKDVFDAMAKNIGQFTILTNNVNKAQRGTSEYTDAINAYNVAAREQNLILIDVNGSMDDQNLKMKLNTDLLVSRAKIQAATNELTKIYGEQVIAQIAIEEALQQKNKWAAELWQDKLDMYQKQIDGLNKYIDAEKKENQTREDIVKLQYENEKKRQEILKMSTKATDDNTTAIKKQANATKQATKEERAAIIAATELKDVNQDIADMAPQIGKAMLMVFDGNKQALYDMWQAGELTYEQYSALFDMIKERGDAQLADEKARNEERKKIILEFTDYAMGLFDAANDYQNTKGDAQIQIYERQQGEQQDILEQRLAAGFITQAQYDAQTAALAEAYNAKKLEIERQQAQRTKALAVFDVSINTAKAIMEIWGAYAANIPLALAFSALAATTGAFQLAAINAQPLPGYAHGRDGGDAEFAYTGEQGTEAIVTNGNVFFTPPTSTLTYLPAGASVIPAPQTASMIESGFFTNSTESLSLQKLDDIEKAIKNKREFHVNITDKGVGMSAKQAANFMNYINRNARI
jgi:hypothetical protein